MSWCTQKATQDYFNQTTSIAIVNNVKSCVSGKGVGKTQRQSGLLGLNIFVTGKCSSK